MTKSLPVAILTAAALCCGSAAFATGAQTATSSKTTTRTTAGTKGRMVTTKTSTGKTVTYDCSKAGNATKAACKK